MEQNYYVNESVDFDALVKFEKKKEFKGLYKNVSIMAGLLLIYNLLLTASAYVFYFVFVSVKTNTLVLSFDTTREYFKEHEYYFDSSAFRMGYSSFVVTLSLLIVLVIARLLFKIKLGSLYRFEKGHGKTIAFGFPAVMCVNLIISLIISFITYYFSKAGVTIPKADFSMSSSSSLAIIMQICYSVIVAPIVEETIYRGLAIHLLKPYGKGMAVVISSLIFGLMHGNVSQALSGFLFALVMGTITVSCNSIVPTICIHMLNNAVATIPEISEALNNNQLIIKIYLGIVITLLLLGFLVIFMNYKKIRLPDNKGCVMPVGKRYLFTVTNIFMLIYWAYIAYEFISSFKAAN